MILLCIASLYITMPKLHFAWTHSTVAPRRSTMLYHCRAKRPKTGRYQRIT